jgi:histidyl-tRNA synthetase
MEIFFLARDAFLKLGLGDVEVKINNRKVLDGIISYVEIPSQIHNKAISILDKMDKIGLEGVKKELLDIKGPENISEEKVDRLTSMISREMTNEATYNKLLKSLVKNTGLEEIKQVLDYSKKLNLDFIQFDPSLARGLDYYTGTTIEVYLKDKELLKSAIVAGGRFDNMIGDFRNERQEVPAVGISFGLERILTVLQKKSEKFKKNVSDIYIIPIGDTKYDCLGICQELRKQNLNVDMHHTKSKRIGDIISYADSTGIRYVGFLGETEIKEHSITLKNLQNENQKTVQIEDVYNEIKIL